jgi:molybdenum cofactor biosynthesis enzyme
MKPYLQTQMEEVQRMIDVFSKRKGCKEALAECKVRMTTLKIKQAMKVKK